MSTSSASTLSIAEFDTLGKLDFGNCDVGNSAALSMRFDGPEPSAMTETLNDPMTQSCTSPARSRPSASALNLSSFVQPFSSSELNPAGLRCV